MLAKSIGVSPVVLFLRMKEERAQLEAMPFVEEKNLLTKKASKS